MRLAGADDDETLYEGVPPHLATPLQSWVSRYLGCTSANEAASTRQHALERLAIECRLRVTSPQQYLGVMANLYKQSREAFLEVLDMHLMLFGYGYDSLRAMLHQGGSAWTVADSPLRLERRVPDEERELYERVAAPLDESSRHLKGAWGKVYGRSPEPGAAWNEAVKAVEVLLKPIAEPTNDKATLSSMLNALEGKPTKWQLTLQTSSSRLTSVEALAQMLRLIYPDPGRHGSAYPKQVTQVQAEQAVGMAVLVVSWLRRDALQRDPAVA